MKSNRTYRRIGTPDFPIATYIGVAGKNMINSSDTTHHPETELALQIAGTTTGQIGDKLTHFREGDIWIIPGGMPHRRIGFSEDSVVHRIIFSPEAIAMHPGHFFQKEFVQPLSEGRLELPTLLRPGDPGYEGVREPLMELESCRIYEENFKQHRLSVIMRICLALMPYCRVREDVPVISDPGNECVKQCMRYIHNHHTERVTLEDIAAYCHLHPNYLCSAFKKHTGMSIFDYLSRVRIETATRLLLRENLPMSKIAELSGFHSECFFYKKFKSLMGTTPKAYQIQAQNITQD